MSVACRACGRTWPRDPALEVPCPSCNAPIGRKCKRPSEHGVYGGQPHAARDRAAMEAGFLELCPAGPTAQRNKEEEQRTKRKEGPAKQLSLL